MEKLHYLLLLTLLALTSSLVASAYDPSPLQDFCVAINNPVDGVFVNGKFCKDPKQVNADDFFFTGLNKPGNTAATPQGSAVTPVFVDQLAGLNTLGISFARLDFAPFGLNSPHIHPRGTEILVVVEGTLLVGFVTFNQNDNTFFTKILRAGDVFVFPIGQLHFQLNLGEGNAFAFAGFSSQSPGVINFDDIANAVFGSKPLISADVIAEAFQVDKNVIGYLQKQFSSKTDNSYT